MKNIQGAPIIKLNAKDCPTCYISLIIMEILHFTKKIIFSLFIILSKTNCKKSLPNILFFPFPYNFFNSEEYTGHTNNVIKCNKIVQLLYFFNNNETTVFLKKIFFSLFLIIKKINCVKIIKIYYYLHY